MNLLRSAAMTFLMFSRIPVPRVEWKEENMQYMLALLPLVGCVEGGLLFLWHWICQKTEIGTILFAAGMTLIPILLTGGIHLDGFCDTVDALSSHASPEKKRQILKDPRAGAFAVIYVVSYLIAVFALYTELSRQGNEIMMACLIPVMGRTASGFAGIAFPVSKEQGMLSAFHHSARKKRALMILGIWLIVTVYGMIRTQPVTGIGMMTGTGVCLIYVYQMSQKEFEGMSGDLAGYLYQIVQLTMLLCLILMGKVV